MSRPTETIDECEARWKATSLPSDSAVPQIEQGGASAIPATDKMLEYQVCRVLLGEPGVAESFVEASTQNGVVTLSGSVASRALRSRAVRLAKALGAKKVLDTQLTVEPRVGVARDKESEGARGVSQAVGSDQPLVKTQQESEQRDQQIEAKVRGALAKELPGNSIQTSTEKGAVTISGSVLNENLHIMAVDLLKSEVGAKVHDALQVAICPIPSVIPKSNSQTLVVPRYESGRPLIANDYLVIEYNAKYDIGTWSDYRRDRFDKRSLRQRTFPLNAKDSFLPVIYSKEKVAVRLCGFHFTDAVTVTTTVNGVPEGGADIRGVAPVTPPASVLSTFDTLQSGVPTGGTTLLPGLGLGAPTALPSLAVTGITLGSIGAEDQTPGKFPAYTPANATASGEQVAVLLYSTARNAMEVSRLIDRTMGQPYPTQGETLSAEEIALLNTKDASSKKRLGEESRSAPGSVKGVKYILALTSEQVRSDESDSTDSVKFDRDMIDVQNVNAQITTLASALSSQAFASNALALLNNYSALVGILDMAKLGTSRTNCQPYMPVLQPANPGLLGKDDLNKLRLADFANWAAAQLVSLSPTQIDWIADPTLRGQLKSIRQNLISAGVSATTSGNDKPLCSEFEKQKITDFWSSYNRQVDSFIANAKPSDLTCKIGGMAPITVSTHDEFEGFAACQLTYLNSKLDALRKALKAIDRETTELYDRMNEWNRRSSMEHTDVLLPLPQNADLKISLVVQRGYTPFTLASANGAITPAVTANTVPMALGTASSSTPGHAARIVHLQVHRLANFNLVGGAMLIHIPTASYGVQASPTYAIASAASPTGYTGTCGGATVNVPVSTPAPSSSVSYTCIVQTQKTDWQISGMAGLAWFPVGHDYYPRKLGVFNTGRNLIPSFLLATSVTSLGNAMGGVNWEPIGGVDFSAGVASAHKGVLPSGITVNSAALPGTTVTTITQEHAGFSFGIGLDLNAITALFSFKGSAAAQP